MKIILNIVNSFLSRCSYRQVLLISIVSVALIAVLDYVDGNEISTSIFYLIPIAISTWYCEHRAGIIFSFFCAFLWFFFDYTTRQYINPVAPYWNASVRLGLFLITEGLLNEVKIHLGNEQTLSRTDGLTGLFNVRGFFERAEKLFGIAARHNRPIALAYIDLDNFKQVNDKLGHSEGDKALRVVGEKFLSSLRATDVAGRLGGDEFAIVLPETDEAGVKAVLAIHSGAPYCRKRKNITGR
jgi:GGDEF domain-containing protein